MAKGKKEGGTRKRNNWTIDMSMHLYTLLKDEVKAGRSAQNGWKDGSGFGWDPIGKRVTALQGAWESFKDRKPEQDLDTSSDEETDDSSSGSSDESGSEESEGDDMGLAQNTSSALSHRRQSGSGKCMGNKHQKAWNKRKRTGSDDDDMDSQSIKSIASSFTQMVNWQSQQQDTFSSL
ncbi:hypothetical protein M427DRAFT_30856 [Gonapodya prolifera JEL478]|uniref:Myb/SANT-like domain-containing protein n=1 Tax=Gonapodya prolifera (strain JEL478) TaxID=1344416 RepID=A0A139AJS6_GONPJ|nr:hypothetical protein M427DRAFT_30856 [Gonapodya prolifera JEL478]|eukprot:KXS17060.1 hypothetical protein M427DRAFT_30856 [Gonapodya prolifera JEL478]